MLQQIHIKIGPDDAFKGARAGRFMLPMFLTGVKLEGGEFRGGKKGEVSDDKGRLLQMDLDVFDGEIVVIA